MNVRPALLVLLLGLVPAVAAADPWLIAPGDYYSEFRAGYRVSDTFHDGTGERPPLPDGGEYEVRGIRNFTELGWKKSMSFRFAIPVESVTRTRDNGFSSSQSGISDILMGLKFKVAGGGKSAIAAGLDFQAPAGYNRRLDPALGDGVQNLIGSIEYGTTLPFGFFTIGGGYRYRTGVLALSDSTMGREPDDDLLITADLAAWLGESFLLSGSYRSSRTFVDQQKPAEGDVFQHLAGLQFLYRISDRLDVFAGSLSTVSAENALHVNQFYAGISVKDTHLNRFQGFLGNTARP